MSDDYQRIEVIMGASRRRRWTTEEKLRIVDETLRSGESISIVARRHGVAANLLYRWRRLMTEGGAVACQSACNLTRNLECAPRIGHFKRLSIDRGPGFLRKKAHAQSPQP